MFGKGKKKNTDYDYDEKIKAVKYKRIYQVLKDISETKTISKDGTDDIDYRALCESIKTKARLAIDFVTDLDKSGEN